MTVPAFKYCVSQWSFSEMLDSPTQNCYLLPCISESLPQQKNSWFFFPRNSPATNVSQIVSWQLPLATYPPHATISLLNTLYKIYASLLQKRLSNGIEDRIWETQFGFRKKKSTSQPLFITRRLQDQAEITGNKLFLIFWTGKKHLTK